MEEDGQSPHRCLSPRDVCHLCAEGTRLCMASTPPSACGHGSLPRKAEGDRRGGGGGTGPQGSLHASGARQPSCCSAFPDGPGSPVQGISVPGKEQRKGRRGTPHEAGWEALQMLIQDRVPCRLSEIQMSGSAVYTQRVFTCISFMCRLGCSRAVEKLQEPAGPTEPHRLTFCLLEEKSPGPNGRSEHSLAPFAEQLRAGTASGPSAGIAPGLASEGPEPRGQRQPCPCPSSPRPAGQVAELGPDPPLNLEASPCPCPRGCPAGEGPRQEASCSVNVCYYYLQKGLRLFR